MIRRYGTPPDPLRKYRARPGVYAILSRGSHILLTHQSAPEPEFQLPGGGIDPGESPLPALHREVLEETGWTLTSARHLSTYRRFTFMPEYDLWAEKLCHIYMANAGIRRHPPTEPDHTAFLIPQPLVPDLLENPGDRAIFLRFRDLLG